MVLRTRRLPLVLILTFPWIVGAARATETITRPFAGITHIACDVSAPRPLRMHIIVIELKTPGIRFLLTPHAGAQETIKQTTLQFLTDQKAQIAINAHFFEPWPAPDPDPGTADLVGFAAFNGVVYSAFDANPPKQIAIHPNAPALSIDAENNATIVHRNPADASGRSVIEPVKLFTALAGNEQILSGGTVTAADREWDKTLNPRSAIGLAPGNKLVLFVVDGRQAGVSEGMSTGEVARLLHDDYGVTDALNLDGGGSTTLCMADPTPHPVNVPIGINSQAGTQRLVGSNLAVFAAAVSPPTTSPATGRAGSEVDSKLFRVVAVEFIVLGGLVSVLVLITRWRQRQGN